MEDLQYILSCSICLEIFREPRLLPCQHTFCTHCLNKYIADNMGEDSSRADEIHCPLCRCKLKINKPPYDATTFPSNRTIQELLDSKDVMKTLEGSAEESSTWKTMTETVREYFSSKSKQAIKISGETMKQCFKKGAEYMTESAGRTKDFIKNGLIPASVRSWNRKLQHARDSICAATGPGRAVQGNPCQSQKARTDGKFQQRLISSLRYICSLTDTAENSKQQQVVPKSSKSRRRIKTMRRPKKEGDSQPNLNEKDAAHHLSHSRSNCCKIEDWFTFQRDSNVTCIYKNILQKTLEPFLTDIFPTESKLFLSLVIIILNILIIICTMGSFFSFVLCLSIVLQLHFVKIKLGNYPRLRDLYAISGYVLVNFLISLGIVLGLRCLQVAWTISVYFR